MFFYLLKTGNKEKNLIKQPEENKTCLLSVEDLLAYKRKKNTTNTELKDTTLKIAALNFFKSFVKKTTVSFESTYYQFDLVHETAHFPCPQISDDTMSQSSWGRGEYFPSSTKGKKRSKA